MPLNTCTPQERIIKTRTGFYPQIFQELEPQISRPGRNSTFCVQQVQGTGDCLFHSIAISMAFDDNETHLDMHDSWLDQRVAQLRALAVDTLVNEANSTFHLEGDQTISASELVAAAAEQYNMTSEEYCNSMRRKGVWGGGPEILALVNAMKRPIHVFEPVAVHNGTEFRLQLCGAFGSPKFDKCGKRVCIVAADDRFPRVRSAPASISVSVYFWHDGPPLHVASNSSRTCGPSCEVFQVACISSSLQLLIRFAQRSGMLGVLESAVVQRRMVPRAQHFDLSYSLGHVPTASTCIRDRLGRCPFQ
eukprot:scaffold26860_cov37-Tisochrysis_lutea.AAC.2